MSEKKVALITGASQGIGKVTALKLASCGYDIAINFIGREDDAKEVKKECEAFGVEAEIYEFDVTNVEAVNAGVDAIVKRFGRIDVLVNNAGITKDGLFLRMTPDQWNAVININLTGAYNVTAPVVKIMMKQRIGSIINMSSIVGVMGNAGQANYSASKAGLIGFTKSLAKELGSRNIRVNAVAPGIIETDMVANLPKEVIEPLIKTIPLGRIGKPVDIANAFLFLASDMASYITGEILQVDGAARS